MTALKLYASRLTVLFYFKGTLEGDFCYSSLDESNLHIVLFHLPTFFQYF